MLRGSGSLLSGIKYKPRVRTKMWFISWEWSQHRAKQTQRMQMDRFLAVCFEDLHWSVLSKHLIYIFVKLVKNLYLSLLAVWTKCLLSERAVTSWLHLGTLWFAGSSGRDHKLPGGTLLSIVIVYACISYSFTKRISLRSCQHGSMDPIVQNICNLTGLWSCCSQ